MASETTVKTRAHAGLKTWLLQADQSEPRTLLVYRAKTPPILQADDSDMRHFALRDEGRNDSRGCFLRRTNTWKAFLKSTSPRFDQGGTLFVVSKISSRSWVFVWDAGFRLGEAKKGNRPKVVLAVWPKRNDRLNCTPVCFTWRVLSRIKAKSAFRFSTGTSLAVFVPQC